MIPRLNARYSFTHLLDNSGPLVPRHHRERVPGGACTQMPITVTNTGGRYFDENFTFLGRLKIEFFDLEGSINLKQNSSFNLHLHRCGGDTAPVVKGTLPHHSPLDETTPPVPDFLIEYPFGDLSAGPG